jgi:hypothetical protein
MTPKEKAEELVNKFMNYADAVPEDYDWIDPVSHCDEKQLTSSKQCALIAVDEIIKIEKNHMNHNWVNYWQKVKQEIETFK